jgi:hypothetical protein
MKSGGISMNLYLNKKQQHMMNLLIDSAEKLIAGVPEDFADTLMELKSKVTGKKMAKNALILEPIEVNCLNSDEKLIVRAREDGRAIIFESKNRVAHNNGHFSFNLGLENSIMLINYMIQYLNHWGMDYTAEDKSYSEEINVFADEVERSISLSGGKISYTCYTDKDDDYWTFLTPYKSKYFVELMLGYINEQKSAQAVS